MHPAFGVRSRALFPLVQMRDVSIVWRRRRRDDRAIGGGAAVSATAEEHTSIERGAGHGERGTRDWTSTWHFQWLVRCRPHADWDGGMMADMYRRLPENSLLFNRANDIYVSASPFVALSWI